MRVFLLFISFCWSLTSIAEDPLSVFETTKWKTSFAEVNLRIYLQKNPSLLNSLRSACSNEEIFPSQGKWKVKKFSESEALKYFGERLSFTDPDFPESGRNRIFVVINDTALLTVSLYNQFLIGASSAAQLVASHGNNGSECFSIESSNEVNSKWWKSPLKISDMSTQ